MERIFSDLSSKRARPQRIERKDLYLAWDFTVASAENLAGRALSMRDDAFAQLGDTDLADGVIQGAPPAFTIDQVTDEAGRATAPTRRGHGHRAQLPHAATCAPTSPSRPRPSRSPRSSRRTSYPSPPRGPG